MSITIALLDDDRNILTSLSLALQSEGFIAAPAASVGDPGGRPPCR